MRPTPENVGELIEAKNVRPSRPDASGTIDALRESATTLPANALRHALLGFAWHQPLSIFSAAFDAGACVLPWALPPIPTTRRMRERAAGSRGTRSRYP